jgi:hypothetical protein
VKGNIVPGLRELDALFGQRPVQHNFDLFDLVNNRLAALFAELVDVFVSELPEIE